MQLSRHRKQNKNERDSCFCLRSFVQLREDEIVIDTKCYFKTSFRAEAMSSIIDTSHLLILKRSDFIINDQWKQNHFTGMKSFFSNDFRIHNILCIEWKFLKKPERHHHFSHVSNANLFRWFLCNLSFTDFYRLTFHTNFIKLLLPF